MTDAAQQLLTALEKAAKTLPNTIPRSVPLARATVDLQTLKPMIETFHGANLIVSAIEPEDLPSFAPYL